MPDRRPVRRQPIRLLRQELVNSAADPADPTYDTTARNRQVAAGSRWLDAGTYLRMKHLDVNVGVLSGLLHASLYPSDISDD